MGSAGEHLLECFLPQARRDAYGVTAAQRHCEGLALARRFIQRRPPNRRSAALDDRSVKQSGAAGAMRWRPAESPPGGRARDGDVARIPAERGDVVADPREHGLLILQPVIARGRILGSKRRMCARKPSAPSR